MAEREQQQENLKSIYNNSLISNFMQAGNEILKNFWQSNTIQVYKKFKVSQPIIWNKT